MNTMQMLRVTVAAAGLVCAPGLALAQDAISAPASKTIGVAKTEMVPSLIVLNSGGATLEGTTLTLTSVPQLDPLRRSSGAGRPVMGSPPISSRSGATAATASARTRPMPPSRS